GDVLGACVGVTFTAAVLIAALWLSRHACRACAGTARCADWLYRSLGHEGGHGRRPAGPGRRDDETDRLPDRRLARRPSGTPPSRAGARRGLARRHGEAYPEGPAAAGSA